MHNDKSDLRRQLNEIVVNLNGQLRVAIILLNDHKHYCFKGANQLTADMKAEAVALQILSDAVATPNEELIDIKFPRFKIHTELCGIIDVNDFLDLTKYNEEIKNNQLKLTDTAYTEWHSNFISELKTNLTKSIRPAINKIISIVNNYSGYSYQFKSFYNCQILINDKNDIEAEIIFTIDLK